MQKFRHYILLMWLPVTLLFTGCEADEKFGDPNRSDIIGFGISDTAAEDKTATRAEVIEAPEYFVARDSLSGDTLCIHPSIRDGIETPQATPTRAAQITGMGDYGSFGVYGYQNNKSQGSTLLLMNNVTMTNTSGNEWTSEDTYYWMGENFSYQFYAYAPANNTAFTTPTTNAGRQFSYVVPAAVNNQSDIVVASTAELTGNYNRTVPLTFHHICSAIQFVVDKSEAIGSIKSVRITGVLNAGTYDMESNRWALSPTAAGEYLLDGSKTLNATTETVFNIGEQTLILLPQTCPETARVEVVLHDDVLNVDRTLTASLAGHTWQMGKTTVYRISSSAINWEYIFEVTPLNAVFPALYGTSQAAYSVTSYRINPYGDMLPVNWNVTGYSTDAGNTWSTSKPAFITSLVTSGTGGNTPVECNAQLNTSGTGNYTIDNAHNALLKRTTSINTTSGQTYYNLSNSSGASAIQNTANCYIVNAPGNYTFPLVYGNAIKNGATNAEAYTSSSKDNNALEKFVNHDNVAITDPYIYNNKDATGNTIVPANAVLIWQDANGVINTSSVTLTSDKKWIRFNVAAANIKQCNAIIAVRNASNTILWSWHIWVTDFVPLAPLRTAAELQAESNYYNTRGTYNYNITQRDKLIECATTGNSYTVMGVNLGWCDGDLLMYDARNVEVRFTQSISQQNKMVTLKQLPDTTTRGNSPYFQFGRKDPMLGWAGVGYQLQKSHYPTAGYTFTPGGQGKVTIGKAIQNPHVFYNYGTDTGSGLFYEDWCDPAATVQGKSSFFNLWNANNVLHEDASKNYNDVIKTIYDPSPVGYHLPPSLAFSGTTYNGSACAGTGHFGVTFNSPYKIPRDVEYSTGWVLYCNNMGQTYSNYDTTGGTIFFPASRGRESHNGALIGSIHGYYWTANPYSELNANFLYLHTGGITPFLQRNRSYGHCVRPVRE